MFDVVGYCTVKKDASTGVGANLKNFIGKDCRVYEFDTDGGVLCMDSGATGLALFDKCDVIRRFECNDVNGVLIPTGMNMIDQMMYVAKVIQRKGGYNLLLKNMVIEISLMKGKLTDDFLFQKERDRKFNKTI
jgi:hypothetical protein